MQFHRCRGYWRVQPVFRTNRAGGLLQAFDAINQRTGEKSTQTDCNAASKHQEDGCQ